MKSITIYKIADRLYFAPHCSLGKGFSRLIEPIREINFDEANDKLGEVFLSTFKSCTIVSSRAELPEGSFKKLLQITKARSQINLVKMAQYLGVNLDENNFTFKRVGANIRYKGFMVDLGIPPVVLSENTEAEVIGQAIKDLFLHK